MRKLWKAAQITMRVGASASCRFRVYGRQNVPTTGGMILAVNHQSFLDPVIIGLAHDREIHYMARESLFRQPVFRALIVALNAFPVKRSGGDVKGVKIAVERLKAGHTLVIFPEGTRTKDGQLGRVRGGVAFIAAKAAVPIVPAYIHGAFKMWPRTGLFPRPAPIKVMFGKSFYVPDGRDWDRTAERISTQLHSMEQELTIKE